MKKAAESKKSMNMDKLATMVKSGFDDMTSIFKTGFDDVKGDVRKLEQKVDNNHEEIKLKLDNVAYRFELVELQRRVELLEKRSFRK